MNVFDSPSFDRHENVVFAHDPASGLRAIIAVHSRALGPAAGGCRMWPYANGSEALEDVLRLSNFDSDTISKLRAPIVAGGANNQLRTDADGQRLLERGILYAPDYVINAGGIISVAHEHFSLGGEREVDDAIGRIAQRLADIFTRSKLEQVPTHLIANQRAEEKIQLARQRRAAA